MSNLSPQPLTFGLELEFILAHSEPPFSDESQRNTCILQPLRAAGLRAIDSFHAYTSVDDGTGMLPYNAWRVDSDSSVAATDEDYEEIQYTYANGVREERREKHGGGTSVEVASRVLALTVDGLKEVERAVEVIRTACTFAPRSAGLHVHVGDGERGFSLPVLQNLVVLMACFEQQFDQAVPLHRVGMQYCESMQRSMFFPADRKRRAMADATYQTVSVGDLVAKVHVLRHDYEFGDEYDWEPCRYRAVNLMNLDEYYNSSRVKRTVEFRQQAGTLDRFQILRWVVTVGALVQIASDFPAGYFLEVIARHTNADGSDDWTFSLLDLFADFGVDFLVPLWQGDLNSWPVDVEKDYEEAWLKVRMVLDEVYWVSYELDWGPDKLVWVSDEVNCGSDELDWGPVEVDWGSDIYMS